MGDGWVSNHNEGPPLTIVAILLFLWIPLVGLAPWTGGLSLLFMPLVYLHFLAKVVWLALVDAFIGGHRLEQELRWKRLVIRWWATEGQVLR